MIALSGSIPGELAAEVPDVSGSTLAQAARTTILASIDPNETQPDRNRTVEQWLRSLTKGHVRSIVWAGGGCRSKRVETPRDAGGRWCGRAEIRLSRPSGPSDTPMIEIYFEKPTGGQPGTPYAFRGIVRMDAVEEYTRFTFDFETAWQVRFPK